MLFGRSAERVLIDGLLTRARELRSGCLVVRGEAGMGKSALLEYAAEQAGELPVLRVSGIESEAEFPFAAVHQLVRPVLDRLDSLPQQHAAAVRGALRLASGRGDDRYLVCLGILGLLAEAAADHGLLCLVDDAHWLDRASAGALLFTARRLEAEGIVMLFTARDDTSSRFEAPGVDEIVIGGLAEGAAADLVGRRARTEVAPAVGMSLARLTGGNPLALTETVRLLTADQLAGRARLPDPLPLGAGVERAFMDQVRRLPAAAQMFLLLAAEDEQGDLSTLLAAAGALGIGLEVIDGAEKSGLLFIGDRVRFRHPLIRSAVRGAAGFAQRRRANQALAEVLTAAEDADRRAWHLAAGAVGADERIAQELERTAERARRRSGYAAACAALRRAADLTADPDGRARRLVGAADAALHAGEPETVGELLDQAADLITPPPSAANPVPAADRVPATDPAHAADPVPAADPASAADLARAADPVSAAGPARAAELARLRGDLLTRRGLLREAHGVLLAGAESIADIDPNLACRMLVMAAEAAMNGDDVPGVTEAGRRAARLAGVTGPDALLLRDLLRGEELQISGEFEAGWALLRSTLRKAESADDIAVLVGVGTGAVFAGAFAEAVPLFERAARLARERGALGELPRVLAKVANMERFCGRLSSALVVADEGLRVARDTGQDLLTAFHLAIIALVHAQRGDEDRCREHAAQALEIAVPEGLSTTVAFADYALALLDLGCGRPEQARDRLGRPAPGAAVIMLYAAPDLVEAACRIGDHDTARRALDRIRAWSSAGGSAVSMAQALRCQAQLAGWPHAQRLFERALQTHADAPYAPYELARTQLAYGAALRRAQRRSESRTQLRAALDGFEQLGTGCWAEQARTELRATGESIRRREPGAIEQLTPQELRIARLVAEGTSNREVAARVFLSPRTVEYHLYKIFPKLGITSRTELAGMVLNFDGAVH